MLTQIPAAAELPCSVSLVRIWIPSDILSIRSSLRAYLSQIPSAHINALKTAIIALANSWMAPHVCNSSHSTCLCGMGFCPLHQSSMTQDCSVPLMPACLCTYSHASSSRRFHLWNYLTTSTLSVLGDRDANAMGRPTTARRGCTLCRNKKRGCRKWTLYHTLNLKHDSTSTINLRVKFWYMICICSSLALPTAQYKNNMCSVSFSSSGETSTEVFK